jgi:hypothetical protein
MPTGYAGEDTGTTERGECRSSEVSGQNLVREGWRKKICLYGTHFVILEGTCENKGKGLTAGNFF